MERMERVKQGRSNWSSLPLLYLRDRTNQEECKCKVDPYSRRPQINSPSNITFKSYFCRPTQIKPLLPLVGENSVTCWPDFESRGRTDIDRTD